MRTVLGKVLLALSLSVPIAAHCDALLEQQAISVTKTYGNGDQITLACNKQNLEMCEIRVVFDKVVDVRPVDFGAVGLVPLLDTIRMYVQVPAQKMYVIVTGVECRAEEEKLVAEKQVDAANCYVEFSINDGKIEWSNVQVLPIQDIDLYGPLKK